MARKGRKPLRTTSDQATMSRKVLLSRRVSFRLMPTFLIASLAATLAAQLQGGERKGTREVSHPSQALVSTMQPMEAALTPGLREVTTCFLRSIERS